VNRKTRVQFSMFTQEREQNVYYRIYNRYYCWYYTYVVNSSVLYKLKTRKHHNNKGLRQIKKGSTKKYIKNLAKRLKIKYASVYP
jgi:hypothetical protein